MLKKQLSLLCVAYILSAPLAANVIYTWVDETGVSHYSQQPPEQQPTKKLYSEDLEQQRIGTVVPEAKSLQAAEPTEQEQAAAAINATDKKQAASICKSARHSLNVLTTHTRLNKQNADTGESVAMTEEQRQAAISEQEKRISLFCQV